MGTEKYEQKILQVLKGNKRMSTSRLMYIVGGLDYPKALRILNQMAVEKKLKKQEETLATYWEVV